MRRTLAALAVTLACTAPAAYAARTAYFNAYGMAGPRQAPEGWCMGVDGGSCFAHVHWHSWGGSTAVGSGKLMQDNCKPNCAAGSETTYPVTVRLSGLTNCSGRRTYRGIQASWLRRLGNGATEERTVYTDALPCIKPL
jgi:hypothetical protein